MLFRIFLPMAILALIVFVGATAEAMPKAKNDVFLRLDADGNGEVTKDEFMKAMPDMREEAFNVIDKDKNGLMTREEWDAFFATHNTGGVSMGSQKPTNETLLIRPPKKAQ